MISSIVAEIGIALGMRFETPPIILDHVHSPGEDILYRAIHQQSLELQEIFAKRPSPYLRLVAKFPEGMGDTKRGVK